VKVYYDSRNPADSRLEVGINWLHGLGLLLALLFGGLAVWLFRYWRRSLRTGAD
jgi:hypothetical protein